MNRIEAIGLIRDNLKKVLRDPKNDFLDVDEDTDLVADGILDSLDGIGFFFALEKSVDVKFQESDMEDGSLFIVSNLINYMQT